MRTKKQIDAAFRGCGVALATMPELDHRRRQAVCDTFDFRCGILSAFAWVLEREDFPGAAEINAFLIGTIAAVEQADAEQRDDTGGER
jgi:hypothetical protein